MIDKRIAAMLLVVSGMAVGLTVGALAGPVLFDEPKMPDDAMSLAGIEKLAVEVKPFPGSLVELGITADLIRDRWIKRLKEADFEIVEGRDQPRLWLEMRVGGDPDLGEAYAFIARIRFIQPVRIDRLDRTLSVPTYVTGAYGMLPPDRLRSEITRTLDERINTFISKVRDATQYVEGEGAEAEAQ